MTAIDRGSVQISYCGLSSVGTLAGFPGRRQQQVENAVVNGSSFNKLALFFDSKPAGQNVLRADNANIDFDGLNAMAGLRFDTGFEADHTGAASSGMGAITGMEIAIPLASIGYTGWALRACAFINGFDHRYLSNQMMGPLPPGTCNPGGLGNWDLNAFAGEQFIVLDQIVPARRTTWGQIKVTYR